MLLTGLKLQYSEVMLVFICVIIDLYLGVLTTLSRLLILAATCYNYLLYCDCNSIVKLFHHLACVKTSKSWAHLAMRLLPRIWGKSWLAVVGVLYSNHKTIIAVLINDLNLQF